MSVRIGHASISENNTVNGVKGDQTKKEVCIRTWYSKPWNYVAIHPSTTVREKIAKTCEAGCANDHIGYGQGDRNTLYNLAKSVDFDLSKVSQNCNCDCSSFMNVCCVAAGVGSYGSNGWTTSNMLDNLVKAGFKIISVASFLSNENFCVRGAIYVRTGSHTVCGLDNGAEYLKTLASIGLDVAATAPKQPEAKPVASKIDTAAYFKRDLAGTYETTANLNLRCGAGTAKATILVMPKGIQVKNFGYYSIANGKKWLFIQYTKGNLKYTGFASETYLKKI